MGDTRKERRTMSPGIKYGNFIMTGILAVGGWQATTLDKIKTDVSTIKTDTVVNTQAILNLNKLHERDIDLFDNKIKSIEIRVTKIEDKDYLRFSTGLK